MSACFMTLSCMYASLIDDTSMRSRHNFNEAIMYVKAAKGVMEHVIDQ